MKILEGSRRDYFSTSMEAEVFCSVFFFFFFLKRKGHRLSHTSVPRYVRSLCDVSVWFGETDHWVCTPSPSVRCQPQSFLAMTDRTRGDRRGMLLMQSPECHWQMHVSYSKLHKTALNLPSTDIGSLEGNFCIGLQDSKEEGWGPTGVKGCIPARGMYPGSKKKGSDMSLSSTSHNMRLKTMSPQNRYQRFSLWETFSFWWAKGGTRF